MCTMTFHKAKTSGGPWNEGPEWQFDGSPQPAVDGRDGIAQVKVSAEDVETLKAMAARTASRTDLDPVRGAELGSGETSAK